MKQRMMRAFILPSFAAFALIAIPGIGSAHAFGDPEQVATRLQHRFDSEAKLLGVSSDEVKDAWADGKSMHDIAKDKGITQEQLRQRMLDVRAQAQKERMQTLVSKGILTQMQADKRIAFERNNKIKKSMKKFPFNHRFFSR